MTPSPAATAGRSQMKLSVGKRKIHNSVIGSSEKGVHTLVRGSKRQGKKAIEATCNMDMQYELQRCS